MQADPGYGPTQEQRMVLVTLAGAFKSRIVGHGYEDPEQLLANPANWRIHSALQESALEDSLTIVGWVRGVLVNRRTQHVVDGHARVALAIRRSEPRVPTDYIDVSLEEEQILLATLDPLAAMAGRDKDKLAELVAGLKGDKVEKLLATMRLKGEPVAPEPKPPTFKVVVTCASFDEQSSLYAKLKAEGLHCSRE